MGRVQVSWRTLLGSLVLSIALFVVANVFYGSGKPAHSARMDVSNVFWVLFLISVLALILLLVVSGVRWLLNRRAPAR